MNLVTYNYPTGVHAKITDEDLLDEAKKRGFYKSYCKWDHLANQFMLGGGRIAFKDSIPRNRHLVFIGFLSAYLTSFTAEHADKVAICAMLLQELTDQDANEVVEDASHDEPNVKQENK